MSKLTRKVCCWLIRPKDIVRLRMPYPDMASGLMRSHMYICEQNDEYDKKLVKCQRFKNYMVTDDTNPITNGVKVTPGVGNPFKSTTVIDCDKHFFIEHVIIPTELIANQSIPQIDQSIFLQITEKVSSAALITIDKQTFLRANYKCANI